MWLRDTSSVRLVAQPWYDPLTMAETANFRVDPRLAALLSENYRSTEQALKELVDNAWDADAENVWVTLPSSTMNGAVIIRDDGWGMTEHEVRQEYLSIARNRRSRGDRSHLKGRPVKGRKGIGKFAGLIAAEVMEVETRSRGKLTRLRISKEEVLKSSGDLVEVDLPIHVEQCEERAKGTQITLTQLNPKLFAPDPAALRQLLAIEYGRQRDFTIWVNGERLAHEDMPGQSFTETIRLPDGVEATLKYTLLDHNPKSAKHAGIVTRVDDKVVGKPGLFGLDQRDEIPAKLLNRVVGEIEIKGLSEFVTGDFGAIVENSTAYREIQETVQKSVAGKIGEVFARDVNLAKARRQREINRRLEQLPEYRREFAQKALNGLFARFWGESEDKIDVMVSLVLEAFEKDEYWTVCQKIEEARHADVVTFAAALETFGLLDMAVMAEQARRRLKLLDDLDELARRPETLEDEMHKPLANNLWVFGAEYSLMASNQTLARTIREYTEKKFTGKRAKKRPDLFLAQNILRQYLLIEFKRPSHTVDRDDENQAEKYRDDLTPRFDVMDILVIGGRVDAEIPSQYQRPDIKLLSYEAIFSTARTQLNWLISQLTA